MTIDGPGPGATAVVDGVDVDAVTAAVRGCPAVDDLYSNPAATVASYLPGRQVAGVRVRSDAVTIQVRGRWGVPFPVLGTQIRTAVASLVDGRRIDIVVGDVSDAPGLRETDFSPASGAGTESEKDQWSTTAGAPPGLPAARSSEPPIPIAAEIQSGS